MMNWRKIICWLTSHNWRVLDGKRYCCACGHEPNDDNVIFCPECGSERLMNNIMVSEGFQYLSCMKCEYKFQDTTDAAVTVTSCYGCYELEKPVVGQDGNPVKQEEE